MAIEASIIIVNWKVRELLHACLQSVFSDAGLKADQMQVIVVDNNSQDGSVEMVREHFPHVAVIANPDNPGFGRANNQALPQCTGRYTVLLNPDTVVLPNALGQLVTHMDRHTDVAVMGCRLLNADHTLQRWTGGSFPRLLNLINHYFFLDRLLPESLRARPFYLDRDVQVDVDVDWVSGACMILRTERLGGVLFDPAFFMYGEDMELCWRLKREGGRVVYTPIASIIHYQGASMKQQQGEVLLASLKGQRQFYSRLHGGKNLWMFDVITVAGFGLRWALYRVLATMKPGGQYLSKSNSSRDLMHRARRIMGGNRVG
jgi:N-acetylglucosaminyl-diphospho-decaprenol L-rhamnosyltransferase